MARRGTEARLAPSAPTCGYRCGLILGKTARRASPRSEHVESRPRGGLSRGLSLLLAVVASLALWSLLAWALPVLWLSLR
jgi:hypothetical protein